MNIIIFGPQASGKGTQAAKIAEKYGLIHISTGEIFRDNIKRKTALGKIAAEIINKGQLVPDNITNKIVADRLLKKDYKGFILDGYPRNRAQAEYLDKKPYKINAVINLQVDEKEIIKRISARRICQNCKEGYNTIFIKPKKEGTCDKCGGKLVMREDDKPEAIKIRLKIYKEQTEPLIKFYKEKGNLINIDGNPEIKKVTRDIFKRVAALQHQ